MAYLYRSQFLGKGGETESNLTLGVSHDATAIEYQFIVSTDRVQVYHGAAEGLGGIGDQFVAHMTFAMMPGTGRKIEHQVAFFGCELFHRIESIIKPAGADHGVGPNVLTYRDPDAQSAMVDHRRFSGGFKIAVFIKHIVSRQQAFVGRGNDASVLTKSSGVVAMSPFAGEITLNRADQGGHSFNGLGDFLQGCLHIADKPFLEQQIAGRVTANHQLGKNHQLCALADQGLIGLHDSMPISGQITDDGIYLGKSDAHDYKPLTMSRFPQSDN